MFKEFQYDEALSTSVKKHNHPYRFSAKRIIDLQHTALDISLNWKERTAGGKAILTLSPYFYTINNFAIDAKHFAIDSFAITLNDSLIGFSSTYDSIQLMVQLDNAITREDTIQCYFEYTAYPEKIVNLASKSDAITNEQGLYFIDPDSTDDDRPTQVWTQGETHSSSCWFPTIDQPNEKMSQDLTITVDTAYKTLSNGELYFSIENANGTRTDHWKQELEHAPYLTVLVVGDFVLFEDSAWNDKPINYYMEPKYAPYAQQVFGHTKEMIEFYSERLGYDFPWDKYSQVVVRDFISGAMENTSASVFYSALNATNIDLIDEHHDEIIAHELFHQWFGDLVTSESWANLALNESFATYGEYLWNEHKYGLNEADYQLHQNLLRYLSESENKQRSIVDYYYKNPNAMFDRHSYEKGGRVLHSLRKYVGEEAFFLAIKNYLHNHQYKATEMADLRQEFEAVTGEDLNWFFDQWFLKPGHPRIDVYYHSVDSIGKMKMVVNQRPSQTNGQLFKLPINVAYHYKGSVKDTMIWVDGDNYEYFIPSKDLQWIDFDTDQAILGEVKSHQGIDWWYYQFKNGEKFMHRYRALEYALNHQYEDTTARKIVEASVYDSSPNIRSKAISRFDQQSIKESKEWMARLKEMASKDSSSLVRSKALKVFMQLKCEDHLPFVEERLASDSSIKVKNVALPLIAKCEPQRAVQLAKDYESNEDVRIQNTVANIYAAYGSIDQFDYLKDQLLNGPDNYTIYRLNIFAVYIQQLNSAEFLDQALSLAIEVLNKENESISLYIGNHLMNAFKKQYEKVYLAKSNLQDPVYQETLLKIDNQIKELETRFSASPAPSH